MPGGHPPSSKTVQPHPKTWCLCSKSSSDFRSSSSLPRILVHISCHHCTLVVQNLVVWFFIRLNQISKPDDLLLQEEQAQGKIQNLLACYRRTLLLSTHSPGLGHTVPGYDEYWLLDFYSGLFFSSCNQLRKFIYQQSMNRNTYIGPAT